MPPVPWREAVPSQSAGCRSVHHRRVARSGTRRADATPAPAHPEGGTGSRCRGRREPDGGVLRRRVERAHGLPRASMQVPDGTVRVTSSTRSGFVSAGGRRSPRTRGEFVAKDRTRDRRAAGAGRVTLRAGGSTSREPPCDLAVDVHAHCEPGGTAGRSGCAVRDARPAGRCCLSPGDEGRRNRGHGTGFPRGLAESPLGEGLSEAPARTGAWPSRALPGVPSPSCVPTT